MYSRLEELNDAHAHGALLCAPAFHASMSHPRCHSKHSRAWAGVVWSAAWATAATCLGCDTSVNIQLLPLVSVTTESTATSDAGASAATSTSQVTGSVSSSVEDAGTSVEDALLHHYDFVGDGTVVRDVRGGADGEAVGGALLDGSGVLELDGVDDFVDLPNGLFSSLDAATIALWVEWRGGPCWQRLFDFGSSATSEDTVSSAVTSLFVTPASCRASHLGPVNHNVMSIMFHTPGSYVLEQDVNPMPADVRQFVVLSAGADGRLALSLNGVVVVNLESTLRLSDLDDVNNWLGRSQWGQDPTLRAAIYDLKVYNRALSESQVGDLLERSRDDI